MNGLRHAFNLILLALLIGAVWMRRPVSRLSMWVSVVWLLSTCAPSLCGLLRVPDTCGCALR